MRVLLIDPPVVFLRGNGKQRYNLLLGLVSLAAVLTENGHDARLMLPDCHPYRGEDPWAELLKKLVEEQPASVRDSAEEQ